MIPEDTDPLLVVAVIGEMLLLIAGLTVLFRLQFTPPGKAYLSRPSPLPFWPINPVDFGLACMAVIAGGIIGQFVAAAFAAEPGLDENTQLMIYGAGFQTGLLAGAWIASYTIRKQLLSFPADRIAEPAQIPPPYPPLNIWRTGGLTLLAAMPILLGLNLIWTFSLEALGFNTDKQELIDLFSNPESLPILIGMTFLAAVVAPVAEELIFRAGFFRYLRTRTPAWLAYTLPAAVFASLHGNLVAFMPLFALGLIFAYAYERSGDIRVPIIAHSLFNSHTILLLLLGVEV